jgi:hypothetical protein
MTKKTELPPYKDPVITTHHDEEILEELGPAQTSYGGPGPGPAPD